MAEHLKLFAQREGSISPDARLAAIPTNAVESRMVERAALIVFERMLTSEAFANDFPAVFSWLQIESGLPMVEWSDVPSDVRRIRGWIWLQQLKLGEHLDDRFVADENIAAYIADVTPTDARVRLSAEELDRRLALQRERGSLAEELVVRIERDRLIRGGAADLAQAVRRISIDDVAAGYDIRSFELNGKPRNIEVKSCAGPRDLFFLSDNEYDAAKRLGASYWLAWVGWASRLPQGPCDVLMFRNLGSLLTRPPNAWSCERVGWAVRRVGDDTGFAQAAASL